MAHLEKASHRLALAQIEDNIALPAMDEINAEIEQLAAERQALQVQADLDLADDLALEHRQQRLAQTILALPDEAMPEAFRAVYEETHGDLEAFAFALGLDPEHPDVIYLFDLVSDASS